MKNSEETDDFLEECMADPSLRDKYSLLTRSLKNKIKVRSKIWISFLKIVVEFFVFPLLWTDMFLVEFYTVLTIKQTGLRMTFPTYVSRNDVTN